MDKCQRCFRKASVTVISMFNTQRICMDCSAKEENHSMYAIARETENQQVINGNMNFKGIGKPFDL